MAASASNRQVRLTPAVKLEIRKTTKLAYVEHVVPTGRYPTRNTSSDCTVGPRRSISGPAFYPMGIFLDSDQKRPDKCRSEIGIPIYGEAKPERGIRIKDLPAMEVATTSHKGPTSDYPKTYKTLNDWISKKGYECIGPSIEVYTKKPKIVRGESIVYAKMSSRFGRNEQPTESLNSSHIFHEDLVQATPFLPTPSEREGHPLGKEILIPAESWVSHYASSDEPS